MPAFGFIEAGMKPVLPPGKAIMKVQSYVFTGNEGWLSQRRYRAPRTFAELARRTESAGFDEHKGLAAGLESCFARDAVQQDAGTPRR
jgi:hypothetical protein